jgi:two-component system NtrC family sensor kinase
MRILIADDDGPSTLLLKRALDTRGLEVITANDGQAAFEMMTKLRPSLAILDWVMPGMDGLELCRRIRATPALANMYILLLTGRAQQSDVVTGLKAGADDYLTKPVGLHELRARVQVGVRVVRAMEERERLLDSVSSILVVVDAAGMVLRWNAAAQKTFGIPAAEVIGRPIRSCGVEWTDPELLTGILDHDRMPARIDDLAFIDAQGARRLIGLTVASLHSEGTPSSTDGFVAFGAEVTMRRALEAQLRQAQKLESVGQLAAGIAHEINTPMQYVGDNVRFLQDAYIAAGRLLESLLALQQTGPNADRAALTQTIVEEVDRLELEYLHAEIPRAIQQSLDGLQHVSRIVKAMKDFSHPGSDAKVAVDLNRAIETTLIVAQNELKYVADTETHLDPDLPLVPCLPGEINQVLLNLLINAAHAIGDVVRSEGGPARGRITVTTRCVERAVEIRVRDTGTGIPADLHQRIFEPFFTTKPVGRGTGQGLALAHAVVVHRHGGGIWFETESGRGTTFVVRLPIENEERGRADAASGTGQLQARAS